MFELPYLEICAEIFEKRFKNKVLQRVDIQQEHGMNVTPAELSESLITNELKKVWREGLSLMFQFKNYNVFEMCLSSSADLQVITENQEGSPAALNFYFSGGQVLSVKSGAELNTFRLHPAQRSAPDVLSREMTYEYLAGLFLNRKEEVKSILVDQNLIRGIWEAYADDILWYAEISPFSAANKIPLDKVKVLHRTIKYVLLDAIKQMRKINSLKFNETVSDLLMIHNANKKRSPTGGIIKLEVVAGKSTYYTDEQQLYV